MRTEDIAIRRRRKTEKVRLGGQTCEGVTCSEVLTGNSVAPRDAVASGGWAADADAPAPRDAAVTDERDLQAGNAGLGHQGGDEGAEAGRDSSAKKAMPELRKVGLKRSA